VRNSPRGMGTLCPRMQKFTSMLKHKMSIWFKLEHDEELARKEALENWYIQIDQRGYSAPHPPKVSLVRDNRLIRPHTSNGTQAMGFRVAVQGDITPKENAG